MSRSHRPSLSGEVVWRSGDRKDGSHGIDVVALDLMRRREPKISVSPKEAILKGESAGREGASREGAGREGAGREGAGREGAGGEGAGGEGGAMPMTFPRTRSM
jgi:hypothetical protein